MPDPPLVVFISSTMRINDRFASLYVKVNRFASPPYVRGSTIGFLRVVRLEYQL